MVRYPASGDGRWGIGRHSDYGLWTMIVTDAAGLEFLHAEHGWARVPHIHGGIVMNVGDVLDRLSGGHLRSAYHRARNLSATSTRLSLPFFYDPSWSARMHTLPVAPLSSPGEREARYQRWAATIDGNRETLIFRPGLVKKCRGPRFPRAFLTRPFRIIWAVLVQSPESQHRYTACPVPPPGLAWPRLPGPSSNSNTRSRYSSVDRR